MDDNADDNVMPSMDWSTMVVAKRLLSNLVWSQLGQGTQMADPLSKKVTPGCPWEYASLEKQRMLGTLRSLAMKVRIRVQKVQANAETKVTHLGTVRSNGVVEFGGLLVLTRFGPR